MFSRSGLLAVLMVCASGAFGAAQSMEEILRKEREAATAVKASGVSVSPRTLTLAVGGTRYLSASVQPSAAANKSLRWSSRQPTIATVNSGNGMVTALSPGTATIVATTVDGGYSASCTVTVTTEYVSTGRTAEKGTSGAGTSMTAVAQLPSADGHIRKGDAFFDSRDWDQAIAEYGEAIKINPNLADAYNNRGMAHDKKSQYDQAISDYGQAIRIDANFADAYFNRGISYRNKGDLDRAISDYSRAIDLNPNFAEAYNNRGIAYRNKNDFDRAISDYGNAIRLDPNYASAYNNRGAAYHLRRDYDRAISDFSQAIRINPNNASAYLNRGNSYGAKGDTARANADWAKARELGGG
jgi:tetratricopeptide (TPR) repeat protein